MRGSRALLGTAVLLMASLALAGPARVEGLRLAAHAGGGRLALDLSQPVEHKVFTLSNPHRVVIDLRPATFGARALPLPAGTGPVQRVRGARRGDGLLRIVLDLDRPMRPRSFVLAADGAHANRLVVDLEPLEAAPAPVKKAPELTAPPRDVVVVVDAGHGGKDPGARGARGGREKDITLAISRRLGEAINAEPGMRAILTRRDDRFLPLRERMERARRAEADLFISIHADAFRDRKVRGTTVYVLSDKGASDEASRRLAERENAAVLIGGVELEDKDPTLASVLIDLSQNAARSASMEVGSEVLEEIGEFSRLRKRKVQQAPFLVLKSPDVPSILIETAFISNPEDERNLRNAHYQQRLADAIVAGLRDYFYNNAPPGTVIARLARQGPPPRDRRYVIRRGDTLSGIASRYKVSVHRIRAANKLRSDRIRVGQVLRIPGAQGS
ncbi:MAG: LysM peptidoglycan-binding domain-containing protein [Gammaproteobacteria bacterium]|nr:MAG: LysM peptidoglycan-binding domain-containing protein [Gammaproteobacteria bacterium]